MGEFSEIHHEEVFSVSQCLRSELVRPVIRKLHIDPEILLL